MKLVAYGEEYNVRICFGAYSNNRLALQLLYWDNEMEGWFPYATMTVNLPDCPIEDTFSCSFVDTNNFPMAEKFIADNGLGVDTGVRGVSGFCTYPLYEFDMVKLCAAQEG